MTPAETFRRATTALDRACGALTDMLHHDGRDADIRTRDLRKRCVSLMAELDAEARHMERAAAQAQPVGAAA